MREIIRYEVPKTKTEKNRYRRKNEPQEKRTRRNMFKANRRLKNSPDSDMEDSK